MLSPCFKCGYLTKTSLGPYSWVCSVCLSPKTSDLEDVRLRPNKEIDDIKNNVTSAAIQTEQKSMSEKKVKTDISSQGDI